MVLESERANFSENVSVCCCWWSKLVFNKIGIDKITSMIKMAEIVFFSERSKFFKVFKIQMKMCKVDKCSSKCFLI
jgi:hypothetical protein